MQKIIFVFISLLIFFSFGISVVFAAAPPIPSAPYCPTSPASIVGETVTWDLVTGANSYEFHFWHHAGPPEEDTTICTGANTESPLLETFFGDLKPDVTYRAQVKACTGTNCDGECSGYSNRCDFHTIKTPNKPKKLVSPKPNGAKGVRLEDDLSLKFEWEAPDEYPTRAPVEKYYLNLRRDGGDSVEIVIDAPATSTDVASSIFERQAKYFWKVKACADLNGNGEMSDNECGPYSDEWSFEYSLLAPENFEIISDVYPITFEWDEAPGAKSYVLTPRLRTKDCEWYRIDCWINTAIKSLINKVKEFLSFRDYDPTCPWTLWEKNLNKCLSIPIPVKEDVPSNQYIDTTCLFVENVKEIGLGYTVTIASCFDERNQQCGPLFYYDDEGKEVRGADPLLFYTGNFPPLPPPVLQEPLYNPAQPIPVIGRKHSLRWYTDIENEPLGQCANFVWLQMVRTADETIILDEKIPNTISLWFSHKLLNDLFKDENALDKKYKWRLQPCWQLLEDKTRCEEGVWSPWWYFRTIGAPPSLTEPASGKIVKIPVILEWKSIDGAGSYYYQVATTSNFADTDIVKKGSIRSSSVPVNYPEIKPNTWYYWRVKTCADEKGEVCGASWSGTRTFQTYPINPPTNLRPAIGTIPTFLKWEADPGAYYYQYMVEYHNTFYGYDDFGQPMHEILEECEDKMGTIIVPSTITSATYFWLGEICLGQYRWRVRSCLEKNCTAGEVPPIVSGWTEANYIATEIVTPPEIGLVPCGRRTNIRHTPYDEREPCQLKHLGFMLQNILDFLLWRLSLIILVLLALATGVIFYFSLGAPDTIVKVKSFWRAAGTGFAIIFLAWIFINLLLAIFGYQAKFFGQWWQLPF